MRTRIGLLFGLIGLFLFEIALSDQDADTLRFVHVVSRHGDRSPNYGTFPTDVNNQAWTWDNGFSQLTKLGIRQEFLFGSFMRQRYIETGFLPSTPNYTKAYVMSQDADRCIMSALSYLGGMYPPIQSKSAKYPTWQVYPIHTTPSEEDSLLNMFSPCPVATAIWNYSIGGGPKAQEFLKRNSQFLEFLEKKSELIIRTLRDIILIYDPIKCEYFHSDSHTWPDWVTMKIFERLRSVYYSSSTYYYSDPAIWKFRGGPLLNEIASRTFNKTVDTTMELNYYGYVAQDVTIMALLEIFGAYDGIVPAYSTALIFELHEIKHKYVIKIFYKNVTNKNDLFPVDVRGCEIKGECSLEEFMKLAQTVDTFDWNAECGFNRKMDEKVGELTVAVTVLAVLTGVLFLLFLVAVTFFCWRY